MNFFTWIREGVKQSVLLGVSDAVEHLGEPPQGEANRQELLNFLREDGAQPAIGTRGRKTTTRRLGRSLKDIDETKAGKG